MSSSDVRSILNLPQAGPSAPRRSTTANPAAKKPDGISRELYALIGDNAPSLAEAQASIAAVKYREKPSLKSKKVHWEWTPFSPAARQDNPVKLGHWARITDADPGVSVRTRTAADPQAQQQLIHAYAFDKGEFPLYVNLADSSAREIKRKQYASELFHLTAAEIAEEEALYIEVKRMEQNERRYRADRDDLMRTIMGLDSGLVEFDQSNVEAIFGIDKNKKRKRAEEGEPAPPPPPPPKKHPKEQAAFDLAHCIYHLPPPPTNPHSSHLASKHPVHQPVHLRSTKIPPPKQNAAIRITELLNELGISAHKLVMPTRNNIETFDSLLQAAGALIDMKRQVDRVEQELRTVKAQKEGLLPIIDSRKARSESVTSTDTTTTTNKNRPSRGL
ncbi:SWR1-complex protein 4 [Kwoniella mangroviensis CBS 8507]|uniref:SWR1-complex protein 4 n=1 Tax=Kwoniella mangroviensis CBS 8507 TaxID=1296122 RepID=UPI00306DDF17